VTQQQLSSVDVVCYIINLIELHKRWKPGEGVSYRLLVLFRPNNKQIRLWGKVKRLKAKRQISFGWCMGRWLGVLIRKTN
jgi:hypothetical protein